MGSKGGSTQQTTSSSGPPPQVMAEYQGLVDRATNVANQPYQPYQGEQVAPLTSQTLSGLGGINAAANTAQPYLQGAAGMTLGASQGVNPQQFGGMGSLAQFMNPYTQSVVGSTEAELNNQNQQQAQFLNSANISSGAFGGDRAGIGQSILANQQQLAEAPTIAGLNQANFTQAMSDWQQQQGVNLAAGQANRAAQLAGAAQLGQIGQSAQQAGLQGAQAQIQAGMIPQQEQQAIDTAAQQMYQTGQAYPFTTTGWLGNIIEGTGAQSGGQSQTTSPAPNQMGQMVGAGVQGLGILGSLFGLSDVRAKENVEEIGKTYDGKNIYRYNFKGDPRTQIGLLAQEEAYHDPGNVKRIGIGDLLGLDYEGATDEAAERGHFQSGGAPVLGPATGMMGAGGMGGMSGYGGTGAMRSASMTPGNALMMMGDPGARMGLGSMALMSGADIHPNPGTALAAPQRRSFQSGGGPQPLGPGGQFGYATPGFQPGVDPLSPTAGVSEALFGELSAGSKNPYTGIDTDQINAIGGGQWLPPVTGAKQPDYSNLGSSPQFGAAESSLAGQFGGSYTPGSTTPAATPAAGSAAGSAGASPFSGFNLTPQEVSMLMGGSNNRFAPGQPQEQFGHGGPGAGASGGAGTGSSMADGGGIGGTEMRAGFQRGGLPADTSQPPYTTNPRFIPIQYPVSGGGRGGNAPIYTALNLGGQGAPAPAPPAIAMQRQLQGKARATAAVRRGLVQPRIIAHDPATGQPHDITPPSRPVTPTPPTAYPMPHRPYTPTLGGPLDPAAIGAPQPRFTAKLPPDFIPAKDQGEEPRYGEPPPYEKGVPPPEPWPTPESAPYGGHSTDYGPPSARTYPMPEPESPGEFLSNLPGRIFRGTPIGRAIGIGRQIMQPSPAETGELPLSLSGARPDYPRTLTPPPRQLPPPNQGGVTDLGTWEGEGGAPGPRDIEPTPRDPRAEMGWGDEGPVNYRGGGRVGFQDGGASANMPYPGQIDPGGVWAPPPTDVSAMSDEDFAKALQGDIAGASAPSDTSWIDKLDWGQHADPANVPSANAAPMSGQRIPPRSLAGASGQPPFAITTSLMGGPPITALNLGHYVPTTGNARGATYVPGAGGEYGISPNARAQAPEHPAITAMRHIARTSGARPRAAPPQLIHDPDPGLPPASGDPRGYDATVNRMTGNFGPAYGPPPPLSYQGGGGVMGASPVDNASGYTPQGFGLDGSTSQGEGLGSFSTAKSAAGFGDLFGGGSRAGFADGGDPFLAEITASSPQRGGGSGVPQPPQAPQQPSGGGGQPQPGSPGDIMGKLGSAAKSLKGGVQTSPTGDNLGVDPNAPWPGPDFTPADTSAMNAVSSGDVFTGLTDADLGFATGGGVGLGSLRRSFQDGGDAPADDPAWDQALTQDVKAGSAKMAAEAGGGGGGGGGGGDVGSLINQNFGDRAGYASTISRLESSGGKNYVGDGGSSFGPFQLHYGGVNKDMPHPGLGDEFTKATGLDARDPSTVPAQVKFVADYTAKHGWGDWSTKSQADKIAGRGGGDLPSAGAMPASATTESYGGGFAIPPGGGQPAQPSQPPTLGSELRRDPFGYMMTVGAGMMASRSPWFGTQVGEGMVAGNKYLAESRDLESKWGLTQAQINNMSAEAREHDADAGLKLTQLDLARRMAQIKINIMRGEGFDVGDGSQGGAGGAGTGVGGIGTLGPLGSTPGAGVADGAGAGPSGGTTVAGGAPAGAAPAPAGGAPTGGAAPATPTTIPALTSDPDWLRGQQLIAKGTRLNLVDPSLGKGYIDQGTALQSAAKDRWEKSVAPIEKQQETAGTAPIEAQKPIYQKYLEDRTKFETTYDSTRSQLGELSNIYQRYQAGRSGEAQAELASWASALGLKLPQAAGFDAAMKSALLQAFDQVANSGLQKAPRAGLREAILTVASPTRDPAALRKIITDSMATLDYNHDLYNTIGSKQYDVSSGVTDFAKQHKYEEYLKKARGEVPMFKGITPETLKTATGEDWPAPPLPSKLPAGTRWSPSQQKWYDPSGKAYDQSGNPV